MKTYLDNPMQGMPQMGFMYGMPQQMMDMQGMPPMMNTDEMSQMKSMSIQDYMRQVPIPMLVSLEQLSPNQIQISYDRDVDVTLGMNPTNYWVKDTINAIPKV